MDQLRRKIQETAAQEEISPTKNLPFPIPLKQKPLALMKEKSAPPTARTYPAYECPAFQERSDFWTAWNSHREYLKKLSMIWMNVSASDAEDAFSDATIRAYEKYAVHSSQISNERAWFARLLHNICIDRHRSNKRQRNLCEKVFENITVDMSVFDTADLTPEGSLINAELGDVLVRAIIDLPERLRTPLVLRLVQGEEYTDIARVLGISNDNARKRVQQARSILRLKLDHLRE